MRQLLTFTLLLIVITIFNFGCAAFQSSKKINLAPFAENAVSIVSEVEYGLSQARAIHVRPFLDGPAVGKYRQSWDRLAKLLRGIVAYSVQVVTISQSELSDNKKANMLADYIAVLGAPAISDPSLGFKITREEFNAAITSMRQQTNYLEALNSAQPIVDEVSRVGTVAMKDLETAQNAARLEVAQAINQRHAPILSFRSNIRDIQGRTFRSIELITRWEKGEKSIADSVLLLDPQLKEYMTPGKPVTKQMKDRMGEQLLWRLTFIETVQKQLFPELEQYQKEMRELDDLITISDRGIKQAKGAIAVWRRSHQVMASGITEPAAIDLFGIAKAALRKVAPIP